MIQHLTVGFKIQESTVHGIRYFVDGENVFHRLVWVVLMACSVGYLSFLIHDSYTDWEVSFISL